MNLGRYRHYKGKEYIVLGVAKHSETLEEMVLYRQDYGDGGLWVRPKDMFLESVEIQGQSTPRFQFMGTEQKCGDDRIRLPAGTDKWLSLDAVNTDNGQRNVGEMDREYAVPMPEVDFTSDLWLFASPWCEEKLDDVGSIDALVRAWVALWNYTVDRTSMDADQIRRTCRGLFDIPTDELIGILAKRKEAFFPEDTRLIERYRVVRGSEDFTIFVEFADREDRRVSKE